MAEDNDSSWDSIMDELDGSSSSDEGGTPPNQPSAVKPKLVAPVLSPQELEQRRAHIESIMDKVLMDIPKEPEDADSPLEYLLYHFYYTVQFFVYHYKLNGDSFFPHVETDSDEVLTEKAYYTHLRYCHKAFSEKLRQLAQQNYAAYFSAVAERPGSKTLLEFMKQLYVHKEMHSRRIKTDPTQSRTKTDTKRATVNCVNKETYDPKNEAHKVRWYVLSNVF